MKQVIFFCILLLIVSCTNLSANDSINDSLPAEIRISEAMEQNIPVKCVYSENETNVTIFMKERFFRMDTLPADAHAIYSADTLYMWVHGQGTSIKLEEIKSLGKMKTQDDIVKAADKDGVVCTQTVLDDNIFNVPDDVLFKDLSEVLKYADDLSR